MKIAPSNAFRIFPHSNPMANTAVLVSLKLYALYHAQFFLSSLDGMDPDKYLIKCQFIGWIPVCAD